MSSVSGPGSMRPGGLPGSQPSTQPSSTRPVTAKTTPEAGQARPAKGVVGQAPTDAVGGARRPVAAKEAAPSAEATALGMTQLGGQEAARQLGALIAKAGAMTGKEAAERGDVDIRTGSGGRFGLTSGTMTNLGRGMATIFKSGDADLQRRAALLLRAIGDAAKVGLRGPNPPRGGREIPAAEARAAMLNSITGLAQPGTRRIWTAIETAFVQLNARAMAGLKGRKPAAGASEPDYDGSATYGGGPASWTNLAGHELFDFDGISSDRVLQSMLGDCYLLSALAAVALKDPKAIENMIKYNAESGQYEVSFYAVEPAPGGEQGELELVKPLKKVTIEVDPSVLVDEDGKAVGAAVIDADGDGLQAIGINLIEKAFALYNDQLRAKYPGMLMFGLGEGSGYNGINVGYPDMALLAITGKATSWDLVPATAIDLWDTLSAANTGEPVMLGAKNDVDLAATGIVPGHAYTVLGTCEVDGVLYVCLRNPWGAVEPGSEDGANGDNDGIFMVRKDDLESHFAAVYFQATAPAKGATAQIGDYSNIGAALQTYVAIAAAQGQDAASTTAALAPNGAPAGFKVSYDVNALVEAVLRESYMQTTYDLAYQAEKVRFYNDMKKAIREQLSVYNRIAADLAGVADEDAGTTNLAGVNTAPPEEPDGAAPATGSGTDDTDPTNSGGTAALTPSDPEFYVESTTDRAQNYPAKHVAVTEFTTLFGEEDSHTLTKMEDYLKDPAAQTRLLAVLPYMTADEVQHLIKSLGGGDMIVLPELQPLLTKIAAALTPGQFLDFAMKYGLPGGQFKDAFEARQSSVIAAAEVATGESLENKDIKDVRNAWFDHVGSQKLAAADSPEEFLDLAMDGVDGAMAKLLEAAPDLGSEELIALFTRLSEGSSSVSKKTLAVELTNVLAPRQLVSIYDAIIKLTWPQPLFGGYGAHKKNTVQNALENVLAGAVKSLEAETGKVFIGMGATAIDAEIKKYDADKVAAAAAAAEAAAAAAAAASAAPDGDLATASGADTAAGAIGAPVLDMDPDDGSVDAIKLIDEPPFIVASGEKLDTKAKLDAAIKELEQQLNSVGDDAQLANVDLQNVLQKQQQTMQLLSTISKMLHDTALAVIRKIGG
ncbi:MAG: hypothetical protein HY903_02415 [Deltaproteobacteria bacterium]|nr:hypothetical protein [Deltaproteobacteria bacterium]